MSELFEAIGAGDEARVRSAIEADSRCVDAAENNVTPILYAVYRGQPALARLLVDQGASFTFAEACALGDEAHALRLLDADPSALNRRSADGFPPLALAVFFGHRDLARRLVDRGADVDAHAENAQLVAAAHAAAAVCDHDTMRLLIGRGADVNARQQGGYTPLHGAAARGDIEMATMLLAAGADPAATGTDGMAPVALARKYGKEEFAEWLEKRER